MKNVLFVSDAFLDGGLETRITEQVNEYNKNGYNASLICSSTCNHHQMPNFQDFSSDFNFVPQNGIFKAKEILDSSKKISNYCKQHHIDFIECQPFWCLIPATLAAQECNIPISYTLHGTFSGNFIDPIYFEIYTIFYLCLCFGLDQITAVSERLTKIYYYASDNISITRNSILLKDIPKNKRFPKNGHYAIASRLYDEKVTLIKTFLLQICNLPSTKQVDIYGDGDQQEDLAAFIEKNHLSNKVQLLGWHPNLSTVLSQKDYDCVFGVGRIITDAITASTPAGILGYGGFAGLVDKENLQHFATTNFISWDTYDEKLLKTEIQRLNKDPQSFVFKPSELSLFNAELNWKHHLEKEVKVQFQDKPIIKKLSSLLHKHQDEDLLLGTSIMDELIDFIDSADKNRLMYIGILQEYNKVIKHRQTELTQKISQLEQSFSWKITKPLRQIRHFMK